MISTSDLSSLPDLPGFRRLTRSLAALEAILCPDWEWRRYTFNSSWNRGEMMAAMSSNSGDHWYAILNRAGIALLGLARQSPTFQPGKPQPWVFAELPPQFQQGLREERSFQPKLVTFCIWRLARDSAWHCGQPEDGADDGSADLLSILAGDPQDYVDFATVQYSRAIPPSAVEAIYHHRPVTSELATSLNPDADFKVLSSDLAEIGYPEA